MEESFTIRPLVGRWVALEVRPTRPLTFLGPFWAVLCGATASGSLLLGGQSILFLVLALLLCDPLLGAWRALWLQSDWRSQLDRASTSSQGWFETTAETSTSWRVRIAGKVSRRIQYIRHVAWPTIDSEIVGLCVVGALTISVALVLGYIPVLLTSLAMLSAIAEGRIGATRGAGLRSVVDLLMPWIIAETALGPFSWISLVYAILFTLVYRSLLGLATARQAHWIVWSNMCQLAIVVLLIASLAPLGAGIVLLGLIAQFLWQVRYNSDHDGQSYARHVQSHVLVAMLIAGLSLWL